MDYEVFDFVDLRKFEPKNYVTSRWVLTIETDKQGNFLRANEVSRTNRRLATNRFTCFHKSRISDELPNCTSQSWDLSTLISKQPFFKDSRKM